MGSTIWIEIRRGTEIECNEEDHSIMCDLSISRKLDRIAGELGVSPISDFFDGSASAADFADFDEVGDLPLPEPEWYDAADGLKTVEALQGHIRADPSLFTFPDDPACAHWRSRLIEELEDCRSLLEKAVSEGLPFHFAIIA